MPDATQVTGEKAATSGGIRLVPQYVDRLRSRNNHKRAASRAINRACVFYNCGNGPETAATMRALHVNDLNQWRILMCWCDMTA